MPIIIRISATCGFARAARDAVAPVGLHALDGDAGGGEGARAVEHGDLAAVEPLQQGGGVDGDELDDALRQRLPAGRLAASRTARSAKSTSRPRSWARLRM